MIETSEFLKKVIAAVRIRKGMDEASLESHVAYSAGQPKTPAVATGAATVVNILKAAEVLKEESGTLVAAAPDSPSIPETVQKTLSISDSMFQSAAEQDLTTTRLGGVQLRIEVTVQCTPEQLDGLGQKLRRVIQDFNESREVRKDGESKTPPLLIRKARWDRPAWLLLLKQRPSTLWGLSKQLW